ncbi:zinc finger BED domain-containing protein RICESLEEPER 1-like [Hevea brasiliensis]|uniref:zinc finger BED domain-containing protein RICESLEEPER 1-like n=1 Tax=Hevea brasiliensis TaxID=3981 RepID=UPI0025DB66CD|nr:zinc finger BED domain-containing protein RICESLEEPER 1-like [Hevea brasiliensis]
MKILKELHNCENSEDERIVEMGKQIKTKFDKYWGSLNKMNVMLFVAVFLDPRYKLDYIKAEYIIYYSESEAKLLVDKVVNALKEMLNEYMSSNDQACMGDNGFGQSANVEKCDKAMIEEDEKIEDYFIQMEEQKLASESELDRYL